MSKNFCDWDVRVIIRVSFQKYFKKIWVGGRYLHFKAEINQAFQVLGTRLPDPLHGGTFSSLYLKSLL